MEHVTDACFYALQPFKLSAYTADEGLQYDTEFPPPLLIKYTSVSSWIHNRLYRQVGNTMSIWDINTLNLSTDHVRYLDFYFRFY